MTDPQSVHLLKSSFTFWYLNRSKSNYNESYENSIKQLISFNTVEQFWSIYSYLLRPSVLPLHVHIHLFRQGIRPLWYSL
jgi:translation initiation factor 4E